MPSRPSPINCPFRNRKTGTIRGKKAIYQKEGYGEIEQIERDPQGRFPSVRFDDRYRIGFGRVSAEVYRSWK